jgi:hypothetical protein
VKGQIFMLHQQFKSILQKAAIAVIATATSFHAHADFYCVVNVQAVLPYYEGSVNVLHSGRGDYTYICNLNSTRTSGLSVEPQTCAMWTALLLQAKRNNTPVTFWYSGSGSCATLATYSNSPVPVYIGPAS